MTMPTLTSMREEPTTVLDVRRGLRAALPLMIGFVPFALVLGAQAAQKGLSAVEVPLMTGLNFGGGARAVPEALAVAEGAAGAVPDV